MMRWAIALVLAFGVAGAAPAMDEEHHHDHPPPEKLGSVTFATSCAPAVGPAFNRAVALLHSFTYSLSEQAFRDVAARDPHCAMAHWGMAMTHYHQLWDPPAGTDLAEGAAQIRQAAAMPHVNARERAFIAALGAYYRDPDQAPPAERAQRYAQAMAEVAHAAPHDDEAQIFYALALVATAPPTDRTHANQKRAVAILAPIYRRRPQHPGLAHYLIHANDSAELAPRGLAAARAYAKIAPSAPHALHMPSHIFTRLGLWDDSIASNLAARAAAHAQGDVGEELHAMDYLTYAYLQRGRFADAARVVADVQAMPGLAAAQFKVGYAAMAMPVRLAVEQGDWNTATTLQPLAGSTPQVSAIAWWARALGHSRAATPSASDADIDQLRARLGELKASGDTYWATQVEVMLKEAQAWRSAAAGDGEAALTELRSAADEEDAVEKLPLTPGPIVPAREQLGELMLRLHRPADAQSAFRAALALAPGRRGALLGQAEAARQLTVSGPH